MSSRVEITSRYATAYRSASKADKSRILNQVVEVTGWSRDHARRRLVAAGKDRPGRGRAVAVRPRKPRARRYSADAVEVLQRVWAASGRQCGKYLAASMRIQLDGLERHRELVIGADRYSPVVREALLAMSAATIDRYLRSTKATDRLRGDSSRNTSPTPRSSVTICRDKAEAEAEPQPEVEAGDFEGDTVAHCGPTLDGTFARTLNLTCVVTGWVFTRSLRNNSHVHVLGGMGAAVEGVPFAITGLDVENGSEFLSAEVLAWAEDRDIFVTRSRRSRKNNRATVESKNMHLVRKYTFHYRYDTPAELLALNRLWPLVNDRFNYLTPTRKPMGYSTDTHGCRTRIYDNPSTPLDRLLAAGVLSRRQQAELRSYRDSLNPAGIARDIAGVQDQLVKLAKDKTDQLYLVTLPNDLPEVHHGLRIRAS